MFVSLSMSGCKPDTAFSSSEYDSSTSGTKISLGDDDIGYWIGGGTNWSFSKNWYVGLDLRYSTSSFDNASQERDNDGVMVGMTVGYTF